MSEDLLNILSENDSDVDNQKLLDYLGGRLSDEEKHEVEKWMIGNSFFNEAVEGLQQAGSEKKVLSSVNDINRQLARYLKQKKGRKAKRKLPAATWTYVAIIVILLLTILIYLVVSKL
jgi:anti-sigma factor RsiW